MKYDFKKKANNVNQLNNYMLAKTLTMFEWQNLPDSIPVIELEKMLQVNGFAFIAKVNNELYALTGGLGGEPDAYGNPTEIIISNPYLKYNETLSLSDGVLIFNDDMKMGLMPLLDKHNTLLAENDINMVINGYSSRMKMVISATDDKTRESANTYVKKTIDGDVAIIGDNVMFDGVKVHSQGTGQQSISQLIEYHQYIKGMLFNEVGLSSAFNMKKERLITSEVEQGEDSLFPFVYNMMANRLKAVEKINDLFNVDIIVDFGSVWNLKNKKFVDNVTGDETNNNVNINEPSNEPTNEPTNEPINEPTNEPSNEPSNDPLESPPTETDIEVAELQAIIIDPDSSIDDIETAKQLIEELKK